METRLRLIVVGHVQGADLTLPASDVMIVVMAPVKMANVLVSALHPARCPNCTVIFSTSSYMFGR